MSLKEFQIESKLGQGSYSSVYKVKRLADGLEYAMKKVKMVNLNEKERENAANQVRILASIKHPNIIGYKEAFMDEASDSLIIIMEYASEGDLHKRISNLAKSGGRLEEKEIWKIFIQIVRGLKVLHGMNILHRDLKSANIFLAKDGMVKIGDLNVSKISEGLCQTQTGTPYYASPEVWKDQPYDAKSDIWAIAVILYEMTAIKLPFRAEDIEGLYKKVVRGIYQKIPSNYSIELSNMIRGMLQIVPQLRPDCDKILSQISQIQQVQRDVLRKTRISETKPTQHTLLDTIKLTKNMRIVIDNLPKPDYTFQTMLSERVRKSRNSCPKNQLLPAISKPEEAKRVRFISEKKREKQVSVGSYLEEEPALLKQTTEVKLAREAKRRVDPRGELPRVFEEMEMKKGKRPLLKSIIE